MCLHGATLCHALQLAFDSKPKASAQFAFVNFEKYADLHQNFTQNMLIFGKNPITSRKIYIAILTVGPVRLPAFQASASFQAIPIDSI